LSPFSTYKYHLDAWGKITTTTTNTRVFSKVFFFSSLYYLQKNGVHKVQRSFVALDRSDGLLYLGDKRIWFCCVLCSRGAFSLSIALSVPQPRLFLSFPHLFFFYYCYYNFLSLINIRWFIYIYTCWDYYCSNNYHYIISHFYY